MKAHFATPADSRPPTCVDADDLAASNSPLVVERVTVAGRDWHVERREGTRTCLLLHGTGASAHSWRRLAADLRPDIGLIVPDLPGHARTRSAPSEPAASTDLSLPAVASAVGALLARLACQPDVVIGHSAGAAIAATLCLDGHLRPDRIVSLNGAILPLDGVLGRLFSPLARVGVGSRWLPRLFSRRAKDVRHVRRLLETTGSRIDDEMVDEYGRLFSDREHVAGVLQLMSCWKLEPLAARLPGLTIPTSLVAGDRDGTIPLRDAYRLDALLPASDLTVVPDAGHLLHEERPGFTASLLHDLPELRP